MKIEAALKKLSALSAPMGLDDYDFSGTWCNELGSTMALSVAGGQVNGTYTSPVSGVGSPVTGKIKGFAKADVLAIVVRWNIASASMTTWVGQVERSAGTDQIKTLWHLVRDIPDQNEPQELWTSVLTGMDLFRRL